jgi:hypothetical protein
VTGFSDRPCRSQRHHRKSAKISEKSEAYFCSQQVSSGPKPAPYCNKHTSSLIKAFSSCESDHDMATEAPVAKHGSVPIPERRRESPPSVLR